MAQPTGELLASLRARDPLTLERLVLDHARRLYRGARCVGFSCNEAEDLTQEVFVTFLDSLDRFEGRAQVGTWLFGILYRKAHERRRARRRDEQSDAIDDVFEARFDATGAWTQPPVHADRLVESGLCPAARDARAAGPPCGGHIRGGTLSRFRGGAHQAVARAVSDAGQLANW